MVGEGYQRTESLVYALQEVSGPVGTLASSVRLPICHQSARLRQ